MFKRSVFYVLLVGGLFSALQMRAMFGNTVFETFFIEQDTISLVEQVEKGKAEPSVLNCSSEDGRGILRELVQHKEQLSLAKRLLNAGADPNFYDYTDVPLSGARGKEAVALLLDHGADPRKCRNSSLNAPLLYYEHAKKKDRNPDLLKEALDAMALLLQKGEDIHRRPFERPLLLMVADSSNSEKDKKRFLSFLVQNGSNPNDSWCRNNKEKLSVYDRLERDPEKQKQSLAAFIRKERGLYLMKPLFVACKKEQEADCPMSKLPFDMIRLICGLVLGIEGPR